MLGVESSPPKRTCWGPITPSTSDCELLGNGVLQMSLVDEAILESRESLIQCSWRPHKKKAMERQRHREKAM